MGRRGGEEEARRKLHLPRLSWRAEGLAKDREGDAGFGLVWT